MDVSARLLGIVSLENGRLAKLRDESLAMAKRDLMMTGTEGYDMNTG